MWYDEGDTTQAFFDYIFFDKNSFFFLNFFLNFFFEFYDENSGGNILDQIDIIL